VSEWQPDDLSSCWSAALSPALSLRGTRPDVHQQRPWWTPTSNPKP